MKEEVETTYNKTAIFATITLKIFELLLIICCIAIIDDPANHQPISNRPLIENRTIQLCYATFGGFLIYTGIYLIVRLLQETTGWRTSAFWSLVGFVLFLACAIAVLRDYTATKERYYWHPQTQRLDFVCVTGAISAVVAVFYLIDLLVTIRYGVKGDIE
ncbi:uncharacterized protein LOC129609029 isoform X2 [Condylostylus longicornis]|nr:uncharacterized protein LOC129609029 isoform X2 [Condylostylus longicornis]XP_055376841.1 uncharacterized protein LOC129609029 isoform X2 [Condylostylus longicornis]XP_055376842.1 uncharacterized protein LOC129609029 isoform X2 [Condylostylus longicornis]